LFSFFMTFSKLHRRAAAMKSAEDTAVTLICVATVPLFKWVCPRTERVPVEHG